MIRLARIRGALLAGSAFSCLWDMPGARPIGVSPVVITGLSEDCCTQARLGIESKTSIFDPRKGKEQQDRAISLSFTIRQYPQAALKFDAVSSFENQRRLLEAMLEEKILPHFVRPIVNTIAHRRLS